MALKFTEHPHSKLFKLPLLRNYGAITLGKHLFYKGEADPWLRAHEMVHLEQEQRHGLIMFWMIYLKDYVKLLWKYRSHSKAYENIPFEVEAYSRNP